jgi:hypothetical protein
VTGDQQPKTLAQRYPHLGADDIDRLRKEMARMRTRGGGRKRQVDANTLRRPKRGGGGSHWVRGDGSPLTSDELASLPPGTLAKLRDRRRQEYDR